MDALRHTRASRVLKGGILCLISKPLYMAERPWASAPAVSLMQFSISLQAFGDGWRMPGRTVNVFSCRGSSHAHTVAVIPYFVNGGRSGGKGLGRQIPDRLEGNRLYVRRACQNRQELARCWSAHPFVGGKARYAAGRSVAVAVGEPAGVGSKRGRHERGGGEGHDSGMWSVCPVGGCVGEREQTWTVTA